MTRRIFARALRAVGKALFVRNGRDPISMARCWTICCDGHQERFGWMTR